MLGKYSLGYINTKLMAADIFTKFYGKGKKEVWKDVCELIGILSKHSYLHVIGRAGHGHVAAVERMTKDKVTPTSATVTAVDPDDHPYLDGFNPFVPTDRCAIQPTKNPKVAVTMVTTKAECPTWEESLDCCMPAVTESQSARRLMKSLDQAYSGYKAVKLRCIRGLVACVRDEREERDSLCIGRSADILAQVQTIVWDGLARADSLKNRSWCQSEECVVHIIRAGSQIGIAENLRCVAYFVVGDCGGAASQKVGSFRKTEER